MTKDNWLSILRSVLTLLGTFLIGHTIFGHTIDSTVWDTIGGASGAVMAIVGTVWGIIDKTSTAEQISSAVRSLLIGLGGIGVSWGFISANTLAAVSSFVVSILPIILSQTAKVTNKQIAAGAVSVSATGKVLKAAPPTKQAAPPPRTP